MESGEPTKSGWLVLTPKRGWRLPPGIKVLEPKNTSQVHTEVMVGLLGYLRRELRVLDMAWDHVDIPDRKADLPLKIRGKAYDIVFKWKGKVVCLEVDVYSQESIR